MAIRQHAHKSERNVCANWSNVKSMTFLLKSSAVKAYGVRLKLS